jgi:hypothetical protein
MVVDLWENGIGLIPDQYPGLNLDLNPFLTISAQKTTAHPSQLLT